MKTRTLQQNKALWQYFTLLAEALNEAGLDQRKLLKESVDIPWSKDSIHAMLWKPIQNAQVMKQSTTELTTKEIDLIYDTLNRHLAEKTGVHVAFPSKEVY